MTQEQKDYIESEEFVEGFRCLELEVPWMVPGAIYKLDEILCKDDRVMEIGSGGSTIFFSKRCKYVASVETSDKWMIEVDAKLREQKADNVFQMVEDNEPELCKLIATIDIPHITVLSVDPQGGYNRSKILNSFLLKDRPMLRIIVLDNYSHEGIFPWHLNGDFKLGEEWEGFRYDHERWAGSGTMIFVKK